MQSASKHPLLIRKHFGQPLNTLGGDIWLGVFAFQSRRSSCIARPHCFAGCKHSGPCQLVPSFSDTCLGALSAEKLCEIALKQGASTTPWSRRSNNVCSAGSRDSLASMPQCRDARPYVSSRCCSRSSCYYDWPA